MVPADNFYRKLLTELDLYFIYKATQKYYGKEGQQSIDPVVFFKILLVGYLNNINSDRQLIDFCSDSLSIRLRINGKFNLQLEEILAFYHQKTIHFSPSDISKTRDMLCFFKTSLFSLQKRDCKLFKFLQFELQLKNKPP